ncbi:hypothetical protein EXE51_05010 [Halorubrum sp. CGM5_25_10-8B]|uniref:hypothetical protein n=1 Tax=Halorubrum sp. CGM5_25_10-8B TaxID=2518115 RepID=UPI0010F9D26B|nr:hypothetical protein [Halorubrum sp. CGM5_25_10-8B]TKX37957.1 hypothetical protein EXE51_05010 [Halorubrum sp. CGM5_25_10-8B]
MSGHNTEIFRHIDGEEPLNDFFVSLLARSDISRILNTIHDDIEFGNEASLVATQRSGLQDHPEGNTKRRTLDWVVRDDEKLVGYESKTNDSLESDQLREERRKLDENAPKRDVYLYAITEDVRKPDRSAEFTWMSWSDVGKAIHDIENKSPIIQLMSDMLKNEGYDGFRGFTPYEQDEGWFIKHQNEAIDLAVEAAERAEEIEFYHRDRIDPHNRVQDSVSTVKSRPSRCLGPSYYVFPNHPIGYQETETTYNIRGDYGWYIAIVVPALHNQVYVQMNVYLSKNPEFRALFKRNATELSNIIDTEGMTVWPSWNSLFQEETPDEFDDPDRIEKIFEKEGGKRKYKRIRMGWEIDTEKESDEIIIETARKMERLHEIFYDGITRRKSFD